MNNYKILKIVKFMGLLQNLPFMHKMKVRKSCKSILTSRVCGNIILQAHLVIIVINRLINLEWMTITKKIKHLCLII